MEVKPEQLKEFKEEILRDIKLQKEIKKMFRVMLAILIVSMLVITILSGFGFSLYLKQPTKKEKMLLEHIASEKEFILKSRQELVILKKLTLERDSIQLVEYKILTDAFRIMVNYEYIKIARKKQV